MKIGLIGAGGWGKNLARTLNDINALGGIAETSAQIRSRMRDLYPQVTLYSEASSILQEDLTAIAIATPAATHFEVAKEALLADKHVFVEKPLALTTSHAEQLVTLARQKNKTLMVGHLLLYQPAIGWIKQYLGDGKLGALWGIHQERLNLGTVRTVENALWSLGVHDVAVFLHLAGELPQQVVAHGQAVIQPGIEDDVYLHLRFPQDTYANLHASWLWPERRRRLTVIGSNGMLAYDEVEQTVTLHQKWIDNELSRQDAGAEVVFEGHAQPLQLELEHFLDCVQEGKRPLSDGESAVAVIQILEEATRQMKEAG